MLFPEKYIQQAEHPKANNFRGRRAKSICAACNCRVSLAVGRTFVNKRLYGHCAFRGDQCARASLARLEPFRRYNKERAASQLGTANERPQ
jgi:hypothetical protein